MIHKEGVAMYGEHDRSDRILGFAVVFLWLAMSSVVWGSTSVSPKIAIHLASPSAKNGCARSAAHPACENIVTAGGLYPQVYYAYVLVVEADSALGVAGASFGIAYNSAAQQGVAMSRAGEYMDATAVPVLTVGYNCCHSVLC